MPDDPDAGREHALEPDVSGSTSRGYSCWPALSVRQDHHRSHRAWRVLQFARQPPSACVMHEAEFGPLQQ